MSRRTGALFGIAVLLLAAVLAWRSTAFWDALSPVTHKQQLYQLAGVTGIDPLLLAAIVKSESNFYPYARSHKGAMGLMQLLPETAAQLADELKIDYQDPEDLYREDINLVLGAHYFSRLLRSYNGDLVLALAAYNAGPAQVRSWKMEAAGGDQDRMIDSIPAPETRAYVRRVLKSYRLFKAIRGVKRFLKGDDHL